jgi:hypothetical protein
VPAEERGITGPEPLKGTWIVLMPVVCLRASPERCEPVPLPDEPKVILPGFALAWAMRSPIEPMLDEGFTRITYGESTAPETAVKLLRASYFTLFSRRAETRCADMVVA